MKKSKKNFNILPIILIPVIIFLGYIGYAKLFKDDTAPVITLENDTMTVSAYDGEAALLAGVTAEDNRDGDLTSSIIIEKKTPLEDGKRTVTYAVIDQAGNVGRAERTVKYTDYEASIFSLTAPLRFPTYSEFKLLAYVKAENIIDGDLTSKVKCITSYDYSGGTPGEYEVEYSVIDSMGKKTCLPVHAEFYDPETEVYSIELSDYLIYVKKGDSFDPMTYFVSSDAGMSPEIESNVDMETAGVYEVKYTVGSDEAVGGSRLVVVVTE